MLWVSWSVVDLRSPKFYFITFECGLTTADNCIQSVSSIHKTVFDCFFVGAGTIHNIYTPSTCGNLGCIIAPEILRVAIAHGPIFMYFLYCERKCMLRWFILCSMSSMLNFMSGVIVRCHLVGAYKSNARISF